MRLAQPAQRQRQIQHVEGAAPTSGRRSGLTPRGAASVANHYFKLSMAVLRSGLAAATALDETTSAEEADKRIEVVWQLVGTLFAAAKDGVDIETAIPLARPRCALARPVA